MYVLVYLLLSIIRLIFDRGKAIAHVEWGSSCDRNIFRFHFTCCFLVCNGLILTAAYDGKYAHELMLEIGYHLVQLFGILHVFGFVLNGEKCAASQLVNEMPRQDCILWSIVIVQLARKQEDDSAPERYGQLLLQVTSLAHMMELYTHNTFGWNVQVLATAAEPSLGQFIIYAIVFQGLSTSLKELIELLTLQLLVSL